MRIGTSGTPQSSAVIGKAKIEPSELIAEYEDLGITSEVLDKSIKLSSAFLSNLGVCSRITFRVSPFDPSLEEQQHKVSKQISWTEAYAKYERSSE